jgi:hypothetical protein
MTISEELLPEFDMEMVSTRRLVERVPSEKGQWKPHPKSYSLGHLTQLVSWMPGWIATTLKGTELNLAGSSPYINHLIHHRGQLTVYLRLIDVPLPAIYGPSADERVPGF